MKYILIALIMVGCAADVASTGKDGKVLTPREECQELIEEHGYDEYRCTCVSVSSTGTYLVTLHEWAPKRSQVGPRVAEDCAFLRANNTTYYTCSSCEYEGPGN